MTQRWQQPWKKQHRTVKVVCLGCLNVSHITLYGLNNEYREMVSKEKCTHCGVTGKLSTSDLPKTRVKLDTSLQMGFDWERKQSNGRKNS